MKLNRKWMLVLALVLSLTMATAGTLAYLTDRDTVENTFTMGNVDIEVEEEYEQDSPLYPGVEVEKQAGITNVHATSDAWVWMTVSVPEDLADYVKLGWATTEVEPIEPVHEGYVSYLVKHPTKLEPRDSTPMYLESVTLSEKVDYQNGSYGYVENGVFEPLNGLDDVKIIVDGFAVQTEGFGSVDEAYTAYTEQWGGLTGSESGANGGLGAAVEVGSDAELAAAIANGEKNIQLLPGEYGVIDVTDVDDEVSIFAAYDDEVTIAGIDGQSNDLHADITIKGVTIDNSKQTEGWYTGTSQKMKPCVGVWGGSYTFEDCVFNVTGASGAETGVMSWWTTNHQVMNFKNCTFNGENDSARAMQIYGNYDLNVTGCTFNTEKDYSIKFVGDEGCVATFKNNTVNATKNFVQTGSAPYAGENYKLVFEDNTLAGGINHVYIENAENQTIIIDGTTMRTIDEAIY